MAAAREKTLAHSRSRDQNLQRGCRFIQNGGYGEKSEKIWVRDMAEVKINKKRKEGSVQGKKEGKKTSFAWESFYEYGKVLDDLVFLFLVSFLLFLSYE